MNHFVIFIKTGTQNIYWCQSKDTDVFWKLNVRLCVSYVKPNSCLNLGDFDICKKVMKKESEIIAFIDI